VPAQCAELFHCDLRQRLVQIAHGDGMMLRREREARMERDEKIGERQEGESVRGVR
jgi:hypothetical protein